MLKSIKIMKEENLICGGIYKIQSKINRNIYIGSTEKFAERLYQHYDTLKKGIHTNRLLQHHVHIHGIEDLKFSILSVIKKKDGETKSDYKERLFINETEWKIKLHPKFNDKVKTYTNIKLGYTTKQFGCSYSR
jgi:group I intron endonuclease